MMRPPDPPQDEYEVATLGPVRILGRPQPVVGCGFVPRVSLWVTTGPFTSYAALRRCVDEYEDAPSRPHDASKCMYSRSRPSPSGASRSRGSSLAVPASHVQRLWGSERTRPRAVFQRTRQHKQPRSRALERAEDPDSTLSSLPLKESWAPAAPEVDGFAARRVFPLRFGPSRSRVSCTSRERPSCRAAGRFASALPPSDDCHLLGKEARRG